MTGSWGIEPYIVRPYTPSDLPGVRAIYGEDEFARPRWLEKHPQMRAYIADEASSYYTDHEPESLFVAEAEGDIVGALLGAVNTNRFEHIYQRHIRPRLITRYLMGNYGGPLWILPVLRTEWAGRNITAPAVDLLHYPAHLHIGVLPDWRRQGIGAALMASYVDYLRRRNIPGYHLYASSFHPLGVAFYRKLHLEVLGEFPWRLHNGFEWLEVMETIFGKRLSNPSVHLA